MNRDRLTRYATPSGLTGAQAVAVVVAESPTVRADASVLNEQDRLQTREAAFGFDAQLKSGGQTVDIGDFLVNPTVRANVVSFTVPTGSLAIISGIGLSYSNPFIGTARAVGWHVTIDGAACPHYRPGTGYLFYYSVGDIAHPASVERIYVQGGSTIAIEVVPITGFNENLTLFGRITGHLSSTSGRV